MLINNAVIIPTGNEIANGIVIDNDSPAIMLEILQNHPKCNITRVAPVLDVEKDIIDKIDQCINSKNDLIVVVGGSGGGHRYYDSCSKDYTHSALQRYLDKLESNEIYGKNGHMWCKLIVGAKANSIIMNVPGPYVEAVAAMKAFMAELCKTKNLRKLVDAITKAVFNQYPDGGIVK